MRLRLPVLTPVVLALALGCSADDDDGGATATEPTAGPGTTEAGPTTDTPTSTSDDPATTDPVDDTTTGAPSDTDDPDTTAGSSESTGGEGFDCTMIPEGPFAATPAFAMTLFNGSEDLAFDGNGGLAAKNGGNVRVVDADGNELMSYANPGSAYGLRFRADGTILVAHYQTGVIAGIDPATGNSSDVATGIAGVNGLYPDFDNQIWVANFSTVRRVTANDTVETVLSGADATSANGVVYDAEREILYYTNYSAGVIRAAAITPTGMPTGTQNIGTIPGAALDGMTLDACGNLYVVDQGGNRIYRLLLDEAGAPIGEPTMILDGPTAANIANAQFGRGEGFDELSLYAAGNPGVVYRIEVGVPGAAVP